jgi:hypothetical protein
MTSGAFGYDVNPRTQDGDIDLRAQKTGLMRLNDALEAARLLSGNLSHGRLTYRKVQVKDASAGRIVAEFAHGDRLHDHRGPRDEATPAYGAMRESGFPVTAPGEIDAEVAADVHRLGFHRNLRGTDR